MPETDASLLRIHEKLQQLLKQHAILQQENKKLKQELLEVKKVSKEKDEHAALLSLRIEVLRAIKGEMKEADKKLFEKKINHFIREIDKCIAYLNG